MPGSLDDRTFKIKIDTVNGIIDTSCRL